MEKRCDFCEDALDGVLHRDRLLLGTKKVGSNLIDVWRSTSASSDAMNSIMTARHRSRTLLDGDSANTLRTVLRQPRSSAS